MSEHFAAAADTPGVGAKSLEQGLARYMTREQLRALASARVGIAGAGGLGSNVAMLLVRSGVRSLRIVDYDVVDASNLNRQWYWPDDIGRPKVEALAKRLLALEPELDCDRLCHRILPGEAAEIFQGCSLVVEALDDAELKASLCASLAGKGVFVVGASGICGYGRPPMQVRRMGKFLVCVGDFSTDMATEPPLGPRVMQAAALQADIVLAQILDGLCT